MNDTFDEEVEKLEARIGVKAGFFHRLLGESDWGFVIQLHAFFEAAATDTLIKRIGCTELADSIGYMDFSGKKVGKAKWLYLLGIIDKEHLNYLSRLSEVRNGFAHIVSNVGIDIQTYIGNLNPSERSSFCKQIGYALNDITEIEGRGLDRAQLFSASPKAAIMAGAYTAMTYILTEHVSIETRQMAKELRESSVKSIAQGGGYLGPRPSAS